MKKIIYVFLIFFLGALVMIFASKNNQTQENQIRYVSLGDSYTIGEGVSSFESWPVQLVQKLQEKNIRITLVANPSVTGWTTQDVIDYELSVYDKSNPEFATLLIGANDWARGVDKNDFKKNLAIILDRMQKKLPEKNKIILVTIPDFSKTPQGSMFNQDEKAVKGILEFNEIIKQEGKKRNLAVVDIYPVSQQVGSDPSLTAPDGLHPSAKGYALWIEKIFPVALKMLKE